MQCARPNPFKKGSVLWCLHEALFNLESKWWTDENREVEIKSNVNGKEATKPRIIKKESSMSGAMTINEMMKDESNQYIRLFLKGPPRSWKTTICAAATRVFERVAFIDAEGGLRKSHLRMIPKEVFGDSSRFGYFKLPVALDGVANLTRCYQESIDKLNQALSQVINGDFDCMIMDTLSEICKRFEELEASKSTDPNWSHISGKISQLTHLVRDARVHVIVTAHTSPGAKKGKQDAGFQPLIPGKSSTYVPSMFNVIGYVEKTEFKGEEAIMITFEGPSEMGVGDRDGIFKAVEIVDPQHPEALFQKYLDGLKGITKGTVTNPSPGRPFGTRPKL